MLAIGLAVISCYEDTGIEPLENNTVPPGPVSNIQVQNLKGKVLLKYTLPSDNDLLYVQASYNLENGTPMEVKSSYYKNSMILEGFSGLQDVEVSIVAVNRSEVKSSPVNIVVNPERASIFDVFESLEITEDFGGFRVEAQNPDEEDIAILILEQNSQGEYETSNNSIYTSRETVNKVLRGYEAVSQNFGFLVRDRWSNVTDTLYTDLTPIFEEVISTSGYNALILDNDQPGYPENVRSNLWDGDTKNWPNVWLTLREDPSENHTVTFEIGVTAKLSRIRIWDYPEWVNNVQTYYYLGNMRHFRIWGTNQQPDQSGSFDNWTLLGEYESVKPSGLPYGQQSNEDVLTIEAGVDYEIPIDAPEVRYIRIQNLENWAGLESLAISEILVYGSEK